MLKPLSRLIKSGAYDYLTKPSDFEKLKVVLRNVSAHAGLLQENAYLSQVVAATQAQTRIIGRSKPMSASDMVHTIAPSDATVLVTGESGTGKERIAKAIHAVPEGVGHICQVNCAAITNLLLESELLVTKKAHLPVRTRGMKGYFIKADGGTIFLMKLEKCPCPCR